MKSMLIPAKLKNTFKFKTRELIFTLNQELESNDLLIDSESHAYLIALSEITDIGKRYEVIMRAFADALCE
jgi:hypothetical protein